VRAVLDRGHQSKLTRRPAPTTPTPSNRAPLEANGRRQGRQHLIEKIRVGQGNRPDFYSAFVNYA
jgi:hypothetical protein